MRLGLKRRGSFQLRNEKISASWIHKISEARASHRKMRKKGLGVSVPVMEGVLDIDITL